VNDTVAGVIPCSSATAKEHCQQKEEKAGEAGTNGGGGGVGDDGDDQGPWRKANG
jgi:hypothetical protein